VTAGLTGLTGLTWDHPRGYAPLDRLGELDAAGGNPYGTVARPLRWDRQPLEGFESAPIDELAARYDILVVDHPGLGHALATGALRPVDELFGTEELAAWRAASIGPSFASYDYAGHQWALPLDAATQVTACRPDLMNAAPPPATWPDVRTLSEHLPILLCLGGPHALLMLLAMCVSAGAEPGAAPGTDGFLDVDAACAAIDLLAEVHARAVARSSALAGLAGANPIGVLEAMAAAAPDAPEAVACSPLLYGYVTYSATGPRHRVTFHDAPAWAPGGRPVGVLGGTGLAVSRRVTDTAAVREHLARLMSPRVQTGLIPAVGGQPSARAAWESAEVNARYADFYRNTARTLDGSWVRPRGPGWIGFQQKASAVVRAGVMDRRPPRAVVAEVNDLFRTEVPA